MRFPRSSLSRVLSGLRSRPWSQTGRRSWAALAGAAVLLTLIGLAAGIAPVTGAAQDKAGAPGEAAPAATAAKTSMTTPTRPAVSPSPRVAATTPSPRTAARRRAAELGTSCRSVAHIGDSTSVDLISSADLPDPAQQLPARYTDVGVKHLLIDASGGRSIVEALPGQVNGYNVAQAWWNQGYRGCWVFALGTNDTANVSVGSAVGLAARIDEMMSVAHGEPVLWVNAVTELTNGAWSAANEQAWDAALVSALSRYQNMRILNWAALAQPGWFLPDGIHYDEAGCAARAQAIAQGLANAFPLDGHSRGQIVP
jgi:hypothetical protein